MATAGAALLPSVWLGGGCLTDRRINLSTPLVRLTIDAGCAVLTVPRVARAIVGPSRAITYDAARVSSVFPARGMTGSRGVGFDDGALPSLPDYFWVRRQDREHLLACLRAAGFAIVGKEQPAIYV